MTIKQSRDFEVNSANLKEVRAYAREVLSNIPEIESTKDDVILALAEAAQNIVKHAYNGNASKDTMRIDIGYENNILTFDLYDKGKPAIPSNIKPRNLDDVKAGGLGTFFIGQIMDEVAFKTSKYDWINHLVLIKKY